MTRSANPYEHRVRRRGELARFLDNPWDQKILDAAIAKEERQQQAQMAARAIYWHVARSRVSAGDIRGR